jgi:hypothetical protein
MHKIRGNIKADEITLGKNYADITAVLTSTLMHCKCENVGTGMLRRLLW